MAKKKINPHVGNDFDRFLEEEGILHEVEIVAAKRVIAWQIAEIMKKEQISKTVKSPVQNIDFPVSLLWRHLLAGLFPLFLLPPLHFLDHYCF